MKTSGIGKNSIILFISSAIASIFTYLFYLFMGRLLGPENYSVLGVMLSIFFVFSVTANVISIIIVKYVAYFEAKNQHEKVKTLFQVSLKVVFYGGNAFLHGFACLQQPHRRFFKDTYNGSDNPPWAANLVFFANDSFLQRNKRCAKVYLIWCGKDC